MHNKPSANRQLHNRVKSAKGRKISSTAWLERHINDEYVRMAAQQGYRSRAAFKLMEINKRFNLLSSAKVVIDLGAAPGSWLQVVTQSSPKATVIAVDLKPVKPLANVQLLEGDFLDASVQTNLEQMLMGRPIDLILSDMAANSCGDRQLDHLRLITLIEGLIHFTKLKLRPGGNLVAKMLRGECETEILSSVRSNFSQVKLFKPQASYADSSEIYLVALNYKP